MSIGLGGPSRIIPDGECGCGVKGCAALEDGPECRYYDKVAGAKRDEAARLRALDAAVIEAAEAWRACESMTKPEWHSYSERALTDAVDARRAALAPVRTVWRVTTERRATVEAGDVCVCEDGRLWVHNEPSDPRFKGGKHHVVVDAHREPTS